MQSFTIVDAEVSTEKQNLEPVGLSPRQKLKVILAALVGFSIFLTVSVTFLAMQKSPPTLDKVDGPIEVCQTEECQTASSSFLSTMNREVDPCEDFYRFSCGKWKPEKGAGDQIRKLRKRILEELIDFIENIGENDLKPLQQMKVLYKSCVDLKQRDLIRASVDSIRVSYDNNNNKSPSHFSEELTKWYQLDLLKLNIGAATSARRLECADRLEKVLMPFAILHKYFLTNMNNGTVYEVQEISAFVKQSFQTIISRLDWMDRYTKGLVNGKVHDMEFFIGYPEWLGNPEAINDCYEGLEFGNGTLGDNLLILKNWESETKESRNPECMRDQVWGKEGISPAELAPRYLDDRTAVVIPGGILQQPFMEMGLRAADFGALGMLVGHELLHAFDSSSTDRRPGENFKISDWSQVVKDTLLNKTMCFTNQHNNYWFSIPGTAHPVDINKGPNHPTLNEDIADTVGLQVSFDAYKLYLAESGSTEPRLPGLEDFTPEQVFFLAFAHAHCSKGNPQSLDSDDYHSSTDEYQVFGALSNSQDFSNAWKCSPSSKMNPEEKCKLF